MASQVQIVNRALSKLGEARILSIDDNLKQARAMKSAFETVRDAELRANRWNFAMKRTSLSALSAAPAWGYEHQYQLPSDCLRLDFIKDSYVAQGLNDYITGEEMPFRVEGRKILTDLTAPLDIRYIYRVTDTEEFDALFVEALACRLAFECAEELTQSSSKKEMAWNEYKARLRDAIKVGAIELPPTQAPDANWMLGRL